MIQPINGNVILKLEVNSVKRTGGGIIYDTAFDRKSYAYGHVYAIGDKESKQWGLSQGDRVMFEKDRAETLTFKSVGDSKMVDYVLIVIKPDHIMAKVPESHDVMDYIGK